MAGRDEPGPSILELDAATACPRSPEQETQVAGKRTRGSGELETAVMSILWRSGDALTSNEILQQMPEPVPAQTTLLTALHRLCEKGRVRRVGEAPRGARFEATSTEAQYASRTMLKTLECSGDRSAALLQFAGDLTTNDLAMLRTAIVERNERRSS